MVTPLRIGGWLLALALLAGCAAPGAADAPAGPVAHMAIENLTAYAWRIELHPLDRVGDMVTLPVGGHESRTVDVPAGKYRVVQAVVTPLPRPPATREFTTQLAAGETYRWPLLTLLSP